MSRWKSCFLLLWLVALAGAAQTPTQTENRFLFVINTSAGMRYATNGITDAVTGLIKSGMQGQMRDGDTFGLWTYNDALHTDFPMNVWSQARKDEIADRVAAFLAKTRFQKRARLDKVLPELHPIIANSRALTIIFIFDGSEAMQGMSFDKDINDLQKEFGRQVRADNVPFVTVLSAHDGKVFDYRVRTPSSISLPETASFFKPAETNVVTTAAPNPAAAANTTPTPAPTPAPAVVASRPPEIHRPEIVLKPTEPDKTNISIAAVPTAPDKTLPVVVTDSTSVQPMDNEAHPKRDSTVAEVAATPANVAPAAPVLTPKPEPPTKSEPPPVVTQPPSSVSSVASPPSHPPENAVGNPAPLPIAVPSPAPLPHVASLAPDMPTSHPTSLSPSKPTAVIETPTKAAPVPMVAVSKPATTVGTPNRLPAVAGPIASALPSPGDHLLLLVIAFSLVTIAAVLVIFLLRHSRTPPSLISQSMDRSR